MPLDWFYGARIHWGSEGTAPPYAVALLRIVAPCSAFQKPYTPPIQLPDLGLFLSNALAVHRLV
jgi:hypothetical protein